MISNVMFVLLLSVLFVGMGEGGDTPDIEAYIMNGVSGYSPYLAYMRIQKLDAVFICGGSLISTQFVVTAAHCLEGSSNLTLCLGVFFRRSPLVAVGVPKSNYILHPDLVLTGGKLTHDIALVKTIEPFTPERLELRGVQIIRLPKPNVDYRTAYVDKSAIISGFGNTEKVLVSDILMKAKVKILSNESCEWYASTFETAHAICTSTKDNLGTGKGDSGGPMVITESDGEITLLGVTSYLVQMGEGKDAEVNVFTYIPSYLDWIHKITGIPLRQ